MVIADDQYSNSRDITSPLTRLIIQMKQELPEDLEDEMKMTKTRVKREMRMKLEESVDRVKMTNNLKRHVEYAKEKGSSVWLSALPLEKNGFALHKSEFLDAINLRYGWLPERLPLKCACSSSFSVEHALSCPKGAYPTVRHNELRDITASPLSEVCTDVSIEPELQPVEGMEQRYSTSITEDNVRSDIRVKGF